MSSMMVFKPVTMAAVERVSSAVSSWPLARGTGDFRSPSTNNFIRSAQACMGPLMLLDSFRATTIDAMIETTITSILMRILEYVSAR